MTETSLQTPTSRVRKWVDSFGLNSVLQTKIDKLKDDILAIKKEGGPEKPAPVRHIKRNTSETEKQEILAEQEQYKADFEVWKQFTSQRFEKLERVYWCIKTLRRLLEAGKDRKDVEAVLLGNLVKGADETQWAFDRRKAVSDSRNLKDLVKNLDLADSAAVSDFCANLEKRFPDVAKFFERDSLMSQKYRFNEEGVLALTSVSEHIIKECCLQAMQTACSENKKTIKPDHILGNSIKKSSIYHFLEKLPHFQALRERRERRELYDIWYMNKKNEMIKKAKAVRLSLGKKYTAEDSPDYSQIKTFGELEFERGYAVKKQTTKRQIYSWKNIDCCSDSQESGFEFYIEKVCKYIENHEIVKSEAGEYVDVIKISSDIKYFLSRILTDFLQYMAPKILILVKFSKVKTVDANVVLSAIKFSLSDSYVSRSGNISWTEDHKLLLSSIEKHLTELKTKKDNKQTLKEISASVEAEAEPEPEPEPEAEAEAEAEPEVEKSAPIRITRARRRNVK